MNERFDHAESKASFVGQLVGAFQAPEEQLPHASLIQPHGVLFALEGQDTLVTRVSENAQQLLGVSAEHLLGRSVGVLLRSADLQAIRRYLQEPASCRAQSLEIPMYAHDQTLRLRGSMHRAGRFLVLELEPSMADEQPSYVDISQQLNDALGRLQTRTRVLEMCALAAEEIRALTGFDRTVIYRFAEDGHCEIIAESRRDGVDSYLGLRCEGNGLPAALQEQYTRSTMHLIPDVGYRPVAVVSAPDAATSTLDLGSSMLRGTSPLHLASLRSRGIGACMTISLLANGRLWGLIACHHGTAKRVPHELRTACAFLGQSLAWQIAAREQAEQHESAARARMINARLIGRVSSRARYRDGLLEDQDALLDIVNARGAAVFCNGECDVVGETPEPDNIARLISFLTALPATTTSDVFSTESLGAMHPGASSYAANASGVLAIRLPDSPASFVLWFRPGTSRSRMGKAGSPGSIDGVPAMHDILMRAGQNRALASSEQGIRLEAEPWKPWELEVASELRHAIVGSVSRRADDLIKATEQLRAANLLRDEIVSNLSHELRTPLNAIIGWAHLLESGDLPEERRAHALEVIVRNARMQTRLVDDLLDISRIARGNLRLNVRSINLVDLITSTVASMKTASDAKEITVQTVLEPEAGPIMGDPGRLQQVIWNLLSNAIKYTLKGGRVQVCLQRRGAGCELSVTDNGVGIPPEELPFVFDRFQRGEVGASRGGLGLGLAIVRSLVELHGGTVEALSDGKGCGACFMVFLPLAAVGGSRIEPESERLPASEHVMAKAPPLSNVRILIVEDDEDSLDLLAEVLRDHGASVIAVDSGSRALDALGRMRPDIIISDIGMPGMDGYELMRRVRELSDGEGGRVPAIALTAYVRSQDRSRAFLAGYQAHVPKPLDIAKLLSTIVSLTRKASPD